MLARWSRNLERKSQANFPRLPLEACIVMKCLRTSWIHLEVLADLMFLRRKELLTEPVLRPGDDKGAKGGHVPEPTTIHRCFRMFGAQASATCIIEGWSLKRWKCTEDLWSNFWFQQSVAESSEESRPPGPWEKACNVLQPCNTKC